MKKFILPVIAMSTLFSMISCSTKFKLDAPYKNITVVSGFLDEADTAHYVRIEKAFLDPNKNALTMAQNPDSNYYAQLNVVMEQVDFLNTGNVVASFPLTQVDMSLEGYPKPTGVFFNAPNYAYKFKANLDPNYSYRLVITNPVTKEIDSAESPVIDDNPATFSVQTLDNSTVNLGGLSFASTLSDQDCEIIAAYAPPTTYNFYGQTSPVAISQLVIRFNWLDSNSSTGVKTPRYYDFNAGYTSIDGNNEIDYKLSDLTLYNAIFAGMGAAPSNISRLLEKCNLSIYLGTPDFYSYEQASLSQGVGLTAGEIEPIYSNIKGANALGIFTGRALRTGTIGFTGPTADSLMVGQITKSANIVEILQ